MPAPPPDRGSSPLDSIEQDKGLIGVSNLAVEEMLLEQQVESIADHDLAAQGVDPSGVVNKKLGLAFWIAAGWIGLLTVGALLTWLAPDLVPIADPIEQPRGTDAVAEVSLPPLSTRLDGSLAVLGTDHLGRDQLSRILYGAQVSLAVGFASVLLGLLIGGTIGLVAGYFRKFIDSSLMAAMDILLAFPALLLALAIVAIRGKGVDNAIIALTVVAIPTIARLMRANTLVFSQREFVVASRTLGASHLRVIGREVLPNVLLTILPFIPLGIAVAIAAEGALAYLGQSVEIPQPSWGGMIAEGRPELDNGNWWVPMIPCFVLVLTLVCLNIIGDSTRKFFSVKEGTL